MVLRNLFLIRNYIFVLRFKKMITRKALIIRPIIYAFIKY